MSRRFASRARVVAQAMASCVAVLGCANAADESRIPGTSDSHGMGGNGGGSGPTEGEKGSAGLGASSGIPNETGGTLISVSSAPVSSAGPDACQTLSCHPTGGDYCGKVGNGCDGTMDCGTCPKADWVCDDGLCKGGPDCTARNSCAEGSAKYCGKIGDDCGGELDCGECALPQICGGSGIPNVCGDPACEPIQCALPVGKYCGQIGDGCGHSIDCGPCPDNAECGGDGIAGVCPGSSGGLACSGLRCNIDTCDGGPTTSVSGFVYDPAGVNPLYNVTVYIPNAPLDPIPTGATCEPCNATLSGKPITTTLTDATGHFRLEGVPTGTDVPLVMQVGRWRRQITIPKVVGCTDNLLGDRQLTRLPRNKSEGNIPRIAITTGGADALECLIPRIGIDASEVTTDAGDGRIHLYAGGNQATTGKTDTGQGATSMVSSGALPHASTLWGSPAKMRGYDIVMFSCEGAENRPVKDPYLANFQDYVDNGGRAFLTHYHYYWLSHGSTVLRNTANYTGTLDGDEVPVTATINTTFPKGAALADWLVNVGASSTRGQLTIYESRNSVSAVTPPTQDWIVLPGSPNQTQYLTFNTPVGAAAEQQCGRVVFTDLHVGAAVAGPPVQGGDQSNPSTPYPKGCSTNPMSPQIKALEFIFFDLAACLIPDFETPTPPTPPPAAAVPPPAAPVPAPPPPPPPPVPH